MSDGPHRSLSMRRRWKKAAEHADRPASTADEVAASVRHALTDDWQLDVAPGLLKSVCNVLDEQQSSLFSDQTLADLESLRRTAAGCELAQAFIDCVVHEVLRGGKGLAAADAAAENALRMWVGRCGRSVEEHYLRESTLHRAERVRRRIQEGFASAQIGMVARALVRGSDNIPAGPAKQQDLDDGVSLR
jgi:hypothetical protein